MAVDGSELRSGRAVRGAVPLNRGGAAIAATAVLLLLAWLTVAAGGCEAPTPEEVVRDFLDAWRRGDDAAAAKLTLEEDLSAFRDGDTFIHPSRPGFSVGQAEMSAETAYVPFTLDLQGERREGTAVLRRQGRLWKISMTATMTAWAAKAPPL